MASTLGKRFLYNSRTLARGRNVLLRHSSSSPKPITERTIGVIGVGQVGTAVTKTLLAKNYKVVSLLDHDAKRCQPFVPPCQISSTSRDLVERSDVVITALPKPPDVKKVFEGPDGLLAGMRKDHIWIDHSTTDHEQTKAFHKKVSEKDAFMLEAPVTGGMEALHKGQMTVMMAGEREVAEKVRPLMEACFQTILYTGPLGTSLIPKVLANMLTQVHILAAGEAMMVAKRSGLDMKVFFDCVRASCGNSFVWETGAPMIMQGTYEPTFSLDLQCKDYYLGEQIAKDARVPLEIMAHAQQLFNRARFTYGDDAPCYIPPKMLEDALNESLRCDDFKDWGYSIQNIDGSSVIRHHGIKLDQKTDEKSE